MTLASFGGEPSRTTVFRFCGVTAMPLVAQFTQGTKIQNASVMHHKDQSSSTVVAHDARTRSHQTTLRLNGGLNTLYIHVSYVGVSIFWCISSQVTHTIMIPATCLQKHACHWEP